jgi:dienelactone hydrolase
MAPSAGDTTLLAGFRTAPFTYDGATHDVHRIGEGPAVIVIHEVPGVTPLVIEFAGRVASQGFTVFMPSLFGADGKPRTQVYTITSMVRACISREFTCLATKKASPVTNWLRGLAGSAHDELGGPGVGAIGMCLTGGFALAMMVDDSIAAPVLSQPATPFPFGAERKRSLSISDEDLARVKERVDAGCPVMGLRFTEDPAVPEDRFATLRRALGDGFIAIEIDSSPGNEFGIKRSAHSVLTEELVDEPGHPTRAALDRVFEFLESRLRP